MDGNLGREADQELTLDPGATPLDVSALDKLTWKERVLGLCWRPEVFRLLRAVKPVLKVGGLVIVTRYDDVRTVLEHDREFHVEGHRIHTANGGHGFVLGMQDDPRCPFRRLRAHATPDVPPSHRDYQAWVMQHFKLEDLASLRPLMREVAERAVGYGGCVDAVAGVITHVAIAVCREYYGVVLPPERESDFANTAFAVSRWMFDPDKDSRFDGLGPRAAARMRHIIQRSIAQSAGDTRDTVIRRLVQAGVPNAQIVAIIFGMIAGFVPTSTMAAGHILEVLLSRRDAYEASRAAALVGDDVRLERCLFEAMRFKPLAREPLRIAQVPFRLAKTWLCSGKVAPGDRVIALTASAMMDQRAVPSPKRFDPEREIPHSLLYGAGLHRCIGAPIASLHAVESLRALLRAGHLRKLKCKPGLKERCGPFPKHMVVAIDRS